MYEIHVEETPGAIEVWVVCLEQPVEIVPCFTGSAVRQTVERRRDKYQIEPDDEDVEPYASDEECLQELQALRERTRRLKRRRLERQARHEAERRAYRDWLERTRI